MKIIEIISWFITAFELLMTVGQKKLFKVILECFVLHSNFKNFNG